MYLNCADCHTSKAKGSFTLSEQAKAFPRCQECARLRNQEYYRKNKDKMQIVKAEYHRKNRDKILEHGRQRWQEKKAAYEPARKRWAEQHRDEMLAYQREKHISFNAFIHSLKEGIPCMDCTNQYPPYVMEYDHVRGEKRFGIGKMANHKRERVLEEIAKCELVCCSCHRIRSHRRRPETQTAKLIAFRDWLKELKAKPCVDCGQVYPPEAMDFDHISGDKVNQVTDMWSWGRNRVLAEIDKCELVCANCHRERTIRRLSVQT